MARMVEALLAAARSAALFVVAYNLTSLSIVFVSFGPLFLILLRDVGIRGNMAYFLILCKTPPGDVVADDTPVKSAR
jgi:hypothetical protein